MPDISTIRVVLETPQVVRISVPDNPAVRIQNVRVFNPPGGGGGGGENIPVIEHSGLRAVDTVGLVVETVIEHLVRFSGGTWIGSDWLLIAGTAADDDDTVIRPHDYAPGTNEKVWVKTVGF